MDVKATLVDRVDRLPDIDIAHADDPIQVMRVDAVVDPAHDGTIDRAFADDVGVDVKVARRVHGVVEVDGLEHPRPGVTPGIPDVKHDVVGAQG